ncbi:hypothetical protein AVEN_166828-1 [Araneus ventricosus]|uniref:Uncharacterized protein n=1 Tax=Araneus ventricosus TaxID=182803 RepID=A0A4Y2UXJ6_ARAVE|nr:hypothetical protein AVEN_166828-1 [Araneus ventricosus]
MREAAETTNQHARDFSIVPIPVKFVKPGGHCIQIKYRSRISYSPDLAPSDFHLFLKREEFLGGKRFGSDEELENAVTTWLNELAAEEYDMGILKLVDRNDKRLNVGESVKEASLCALDQRGASVLCHASDITDGLVSISPSRRVGKIWRSAVLEIACAKPDYAETTVLSIFGGSRPDCFVRCCCR